MTLTYAEEIQARVSKQSDVGQVINTIQQIYTQMERFRVLTARFSTDQDFSDQFDALMWTDEVDGPAIISQMMYDINQMNTAWRANANYRKILGLPPLP
jgi:hypothetical protein